MPGHNADLCRIYDAERLKENGGRKSLQWFDIAKEPREYQDKLMAYLKAYGPIKDQGPTAPEFVDKRLEETRVALAQQAENVQDAEGQGRRGLGYKRQRNGRGQN
jgi:hypothetical protein